MRRLAVLLAGRRGAIGVASAVVAARAHRAATHPHVTLYTVVVLPGSALAAVFGLSVLAIHEPAWDAPRFSLRRVVGVVLLSLLIVALVRDVLFTLLCSPPLA